MGMTRMVHIRIMAAKENLGKIKTSFKIITKHNIYTVKYFLSLIFNFIRYQLLQKFMIIQNSNY